jgi:uncharacterized protein YcbX
VRLTGIHSYPVKGVHRVDHDAVDVELWGLAGDRRWMLVDDEGVGVTQRETAVLATVHARVRPGGLVLRAEGRPDLEVEEPVGAAAEPVRTFRSLERRAARPAGPAADAWFGAVLDREVRLVWLSDPSHGSMSFADAFPLLLGNAASLAALGDWLVEAGEEPVPMARFRPNVVVEGAGAWDEDDWIGRRLRIGEAEFDVTGACGRCLVTTIDQETGRKETGPQGREPLRILGTYRNVDQSLRFGVHMAPVRRARISLGDPVVLVP